MKRQSFSKCWLWLALSLAGTAAITRGAEPLKLHSANPHYFLFRGKPTVLISSGEHYGAVLNQDFDYHTYLDTLKAEGMNLTRAVPGTSLESTNARTYRGGDQNTFAPRPGRFLAPWARSDTPGYFHGGNKFDLDRWDNAFFQRLKDFVSAAGEGGIVVEFNLFYVLYGDGPEFGKLEGTERFEDRKMGRPSPKIIFLSLIFLSIAER